MLYDAHKSTNQLEFLCWNYERYDLDKENKRRIEGRVSANNNRKRVKPFHWIINYFWKLAD